MPSPGGFSFSEEDASVVRLPSKLKYNISNLSERTQDIARALRHKSPAEDREDPPELVLKTCREYHGQDDWYYTFQILEVVPYSIRIGSPDSQEYATPKCHGPHSDEYHGVESRSDAKGKSKEAEAQDPCKHMVFLMDWIAKHALYDHHPDEELTMTESGLARELGGSFQQISNIRLNVLADAFPCDMTLPDGEAIVSESRVLEAQEILALIAGTTLEQVRDRLGQTYDGRQLVYPGNILATLYSLILASRHLTALIRSQLEPSDPPLDPYLALQRRVTRIISELDAYEDALKGAKESGSHGTEETDTTHPLHPDSPNIAWAAEQIQHCVQQVEVLVSRGINPLAGWERDSAAKSLVRILRAVVEHNRDSFPGYSNREIPKDDRNLYARLIGNHDNDFVYSALTLLDDQTDYIPDLELIMNTIEDLDYGSKVSYNDKMRGLIARMRSNVSRRSRYSSVESHAHVQAASPIGPAPRQRTGGPTDQFRVPSVTSTPSRRDRQGSGRGGRGGSSSGAGSKRTGSGTGDRDSKRAR